MHNAHKTITDHSLFSNMKVAVVDDHALIRRGLSSVLSENGVDNVDTFKDAMSLVDSMNAGNLYDFYIIDLELPDLDVFVLIEMVRAHNSIACIIVSTIHDEIWTLRKLLEHEVNAIIYKSSDVNEIIYAMKEILEGRNYYSEAVKGSLKIAYDNNHPSMRELEVLYQIASGKTSREIAEALFITENTVEAHRKSLFHKLEATNVADLIVKAFTKGYLKQNNITP